MSRSGRVQPVSLFWAGERIHKASQSIPKPPLSVHCLFLYVQSYAVVDNPYCFSWPLSKTAVSFSWFETAKLCFLYWILTVSPAFRRKETFEKSIFWSPQEDLGAFERGVLAQFVFPPLSHMTWCILWKQTCCRWFYFRKFSDIRVCVCVCTMACDGSSDFSPFIPGQCGTTGRVDVLEVLRVSEDQQQNQIKCHLDSSEWRDCLTAQGNGFALHLLFWLRILFLPLNTNLPCLGG